MQHSETDDFDLITADPKWVKALSVLHHSLFSKGWTEADFLNFLENKNDLMLISVCRNSGELAGFAVARMVLDEAEILTIGVSELFQKRGVGFILCQSMLDCLKGKGIISLFLELRASNLAAAALYEKSGFKLVARRKDYYSSEGSLKREDALIMKNNL